MLIQSVIATIHDTFSSISEILSAIVFVPISIGDAELPIIVLLLLGTGLVLSIYYRGASITSIPRALKLALSPSPHGGPAIGEVSHFQALTTALSGTVGIGSIGGVAVAITLGGPGTIFWIAIAGILAMPTKFTECVLGVMYRRLKSPYVGGPMYTLEHGFEELKYPFFGRVLAVIYAFGILFCAFGIGATFQSNQISHQLLFFTPADVQADVALILVGVVLAIIVCAVLIGGIKSIANVTEKLVPFMIMFYLITAVSIVLWHWQQIPAAIGLIMSDAFSFKSSSGGIAVAMIIGFQRAIFTNEAGVGSAAIAHSATKGMSPLEQGLISLTEPLIATVLVCTITGLLLVISLVLPGHPLPETAGVALTTEAFQTHLPFLIYPLTVIIFLFGLSTMLAWGLYGQVGWQYLFGYNKWSLSCYQMTYCALILIGGLLSLQAIVAFSDALLFFIALPNLVACWALAPKVKALLNQKS